MKALFVSTCLVASVASGDGRATKPVVYPYFDRIDDGPAFFVECENATGAPLSSASPSWYRPMRIDGEIDPPQGYIGPGLMSDIRPGAMWRGIIALRQTENAYGPAVKFGAVVRWGLLHPVSAGRHTFSVECNGVRSMDVEFYWDGEYAPK